VGGQVGGQVAREPGPHDSVILKFCKTPKSLQEIMAQIGLRKRDHVTAHVKTLIQAGLLSPTIPDKPRSRLQKYVATAAGAEPAG